MPLTPLPSRREELLVVDFTSASIGLLILNAGKISLTILPPALGALLGCSG